MKRNLFAFATLLIIAGGCGVHVGNGLKKYASPLGFEIQYHESLELKESADRTEIFITEAGKSSANSEALASVSSVNEHLISYAHFKVRTDRRFQNLLEIKNEAVQENPGKTILPLTTTENNGWLIDSSAGDRYQVRFFFMTTNQQMVVANVEASGASRDKFAAIGKSFKGGNASTVAMSPIVPRVLEAKRVDAVLALGNVAEFKTEALTKLNYQITVSGNQKIHISKSISAEKGNAQAEAFVQASIHLERHIPADWRLNPHEKSQIFVRRNDQRPMIADLTYDGVEDHSRSFSYRVQGSETEDLVVSFETNLKDEKGHFTQLGEISKMIEEALVFTQPVSAELP